MSLIVVVKKKGRPEGRTDGGSFVISFGGQKSVT